MHMFCYQCQETSMERGCTYFGACGKSDETANLQDLLIHLLRGVAFWAERAGEGGKREAGLFISESLFMTVTNTNFDPDRFVARIREGISLRARLRAASPAPDVEPPEASAPDPAVWEPEDEDAIRRKSLSVDIRSIKDADLRSLQELSVYGLKGAGAYAFHAAALGHYDDALLDSMIRALAAMNFPRTESELEEAAVETGRIMIAAMALLDQAHAAVYGTPEIVRVPLGVRKNPGILVTGHDLRDLEELLEQTEGTGVDVYTHSEMWAAHQYPRLRKFGHLVGNYGNA